MTKKQQAVLKMELKWYKDLEPEAIKSLLSSGEIKQYLVILGDGGGTSALSNIGIVFAKSEIEATRKARQLWNLDSLFWHLISIRELERLNDGWTFYI